MKGIDFSKKAIEFCRKYYSVDGLSFAQGDAENLPLADNSVDVIINLESSHCALWFDDGIPQPEVGSRAAPRWALPVSDHRDHDKLNLIANSSKLPV